MAKHPYHQSRPLPDNPSILLKRVRVEHYDHPVALVETFVDPSRFSGACIRCTRC